jgi:hypothetical protein
MREELIVVDCSKSRARLGGGATSRILFKAAQEAKYNKDTSVLTVVALWNI